MRTGEDGGDGSVVGLVVEVEDGSSYSKRSGFAV